MNEIINEIIFKMIAMKVLEYTRMAAVILAFLGIVNLTCSLIVRCLQMRQREEEAFKVEGNYEIKGGDE